MSKQNESGRSMIEMLGVIAIMGVIMYGAVAGISFALEMYKINEAHTEIEELSKAVIDMGDFLGSYAFLGDVANASAVLCANDAFPICKENQMIGQWGGEVKVEKVCNSGRCSSFKITYENISRKSCERIIEDMLFEYVHPTSPAKKEDCSGSNNMVFTL